MPDETTPRIRLLDLSPGALAALLREELGEPGYRARQILHGIYRLRRRDLASMTDLPKELRGRLGERFDLALPRVADERVSTDGSRKYALALDDGRRIEAVQLVNGERTTFCLSSQVGCAFGCDFCLTARMGLVRQLTAGEILGQVLLLADRAGLGREGYNLVFMGMGEPLHNFDAVAGALEMLLSPEGLGLSYRRVTLSTVGHREGIVRLGALERRPRLAVSLNASHDGLRSRMMPVNRSCSLDQLMDVLAAYPLRRGERITFEYVLMAGVNDSPEDADRLARLVGRVPAKVNVIPFNEDDALPYRRPAEETVVAFRDRLHSHATSASIRWSRGLDIRAACGQLLLEEA